MIGKLKETKWFGKCSEYVFIEGWEDTWAVMSSGFYKHDPNSSEVIGAEASTFTLAVCLAALLAVLE